MTPLASPTYTPQYNGSCERSGGTFKARVEHLARRAGRAGRWKDEDVARALWLANTTARPRGATRPTPAEAFAGRSAVTTRERDTFRQAIEESTRAAWLLFERETGRMPTCSERAAIDRKAKQHALCALGYEDEGTGCIFGFEDTPTVGVPGPIDPYTVTWDYIGIVLDRCNNWALRAVRRFMVQRTVAITEGPNGSGYLVQDAPWGEGTGTARPGGWDHVGPLDQATAWKRAESGAPPPGRPRPAGELAPGQG